MRLCDRAHEVFLELSFPAYVRDETVSSGPGAVAKVLSFPAYVRDETAGISATCCIRVQSHKSANLEKENIINLPNLRKY